MTTNLFAQLQSSLGSAYSLERELPGGGMSRVFVAEETALGRKVVIKVLPPELAGVVSIERFMREIALAARLQHAHIVPLHSAGECDGLPFFTMPFVEGDSLRVRLAKQGELAITEAIRVLREIASALAYAHEHGVVHRDIKPDNILLSGDAAMVTDFGVAKALVNSTLDVRHAALGDQVSGGREAEMTRPLTSLGVALGTPAYMAPEQAAADSTIDHRADIYAFGALAYEALTGHALFSGRSPSALLVAQLTELPEPIARRRPTIPPALAALVMRCLEKRPADRPQTAVEIVHLLDGIGTPAVGTEVTRVAGGEWTRRVLSLRRLAWGAAAVLIAGAIGAIVYWRSVPARPLLAILPFENLGQPADEYFADGLTEEVSSRLASVSGLGIIGRSSAQQYKRSTKSLQEIASDLRVNYLLTGTVRWQRLANGTSRVRVSPQLIRASDQTSTWAKSYEGPLSDVFSFQAAVAEGVAEAMNVAVHAPERRAVSTVPTKSLEAYDAYLRGMASSTRSRLSQIGARRVAIAEFQRASALDPSFAAAHARLAIAYVNATRYGDDAGALKDAALHLQAAISLDSAAGETRLAQAWYSLEQNDLEEAHRAVQLLSRGTAVNSQALYLEGVIDERRDRPDEAIASYRRAETLEPTSPDPPASLAALYDALGRHAEALASREREVDLAPDNPETYFVQAVSYVLWRYDTAAARQVLQRGIVATSQAKMVRLPRSWVFDWVGVLPPVLRTALDTLSRSAAAGTFPGLLFDEMKLRFYTLGGQPQRARIYADSITRLLEPGRSPGDPERGLLLAAAYVSLGRTREAQQESDAAFALASRLPEPGRRIPIVMAAAWVDVATGRLDLALERLRSITQLRCGFYLSAALLREDRVWAPLRSRPRFAQVVAALK